MGRHEAILWSRHVAARRVAAAQSADRAERLRRRSLRRKMVLLLSAALSDGGEARREVKRTEGGWQNSTINGYVEHGDDQTYYSNFRCTKENFGILLQQLQSAGYLVDNKCRNLQKRQTARFKLGVCLYFFAGHGRSDAKVVGDAASLGRSTVELYLNKFCDGVIDVLRPIYMSGKPPSADNVERVRQAFAVRRGVFRMSHLPAMARTLRSAAALTTATTRAGRCAARAAAASARVA